MKIAIVGTGYVGLVSGTCLADLGHQVLCIDNDPNKLETLRHAKTPIFEPGLEILLEKNYKSGNLDFSDSLKKAVDESEAIFLCLPTPPTEDGSADLSYVLGVSQEIAKIATDKKLIITKSTVPVGTGDRIKEIFAKANKDYLEVASNPEFLREGKAVEDFMKPDRIVIGVESDYGQELLTKIYKPLIDNGAILLTTTLRSSELTKYAANSFLATKISFINEIANLCQKVGADIEEVARGVGLDDRIGNRFLQAGIGYGGSCFPKDVLALHTTGSQLQENLIILDAVMHVNENQRKRFVERVAKRFNNQLQGKKVAVWGLAFKPDTDDIRKAPAIEIIQKLQDLGADVIAYDPEAMGTFASYSGVEVKYAKSATEAVQEAEVLLILTDWQEFKEFDLKKLKETMQAAIVFDGRNIYVPSKIRSLGFEYHSIGRP